MPIRKATTLATADKKRPGEKKANSSLAENLQATFTWLKRHSSKKNLEGMSRYGIPSDNALGVTMADLKRLARQLGQNHELAAALWDSGVYEARLLASFVDEPDLVTSAQMERWCRDFDNWAIVDTVCYALFDRTPHAWQKVAKWCNRQDEFVKRAGFALLWALTVHDKRAGDEAFAEGLVFIERAAHDERHYVKKAVNMALRAIGKRNRALHAAAVVVAQRLAAINEPAARWVGKDALRELTSDAVIQRLAKASRSRRP